MVCSGSKIDAIIVSMCLLLLDKSKRKISKIKEKHKLLKKNSARRKKKLIETVTTDVNINLNKLKVEFNENSVKPKEQKPSSLSNCSFIK